MGQHQNSEYSSSPYPLHTSSIDYKETFDYNLPPWTRELDYSTNPIPGKVYYTSQTNPSMSYTTNQLHPSMNHTTNQLHPSMSHTTNQLHPLDLRNQLYPSMTNSTGLSYQTNTNSGGQLIPTNNKRCDFKNIKNKEDIISLLKIMKKRVEDLIYINKGIDELDILEKTIDIEIDSINTGYANFSITPRLYLLVGLIKNLVCSNENCKTLRIILKEANDAYELSKE